MGAKQERKLVAVLFSDVSDSTGLSARLEPEDYVQVLEELRALVERVASAHGGELFRLDGDGSLCLFGHPEAFENAGRRATEAALDLHAALAATPIARASAHGGRPLMLHSGVHAGLALVRNGDLVRGKYEVLGNVTNVAARLSDAAEPGEILVSAESLGSERHFFVTGAPRQVRLSGRSGHMPAWPVMGRAEPMSRYEARSREGLTPYQGRARQKQALADWLAAGPASPPLLLLHGPAGIGKSRFLHQVAQDGQAQGWQVARGYCEAYLGASPLQPFVQIAQEAALEPARPPVEPPAEAPTGPLAAAQPDTPGQRAENTTDALLARLRQRAAQAPLLLLIDDWQWADDASRALLSRLLAPEPAAARIKLLIATREPEGGSTAAEHPARLLDLPPLDPQETLQAIDALLNAPDPFAIARIEQASGGSPLLIEELCHAFAGGAAVPPRDPRGAWFDLAVQARFARLGLAERHLLRQAAAMGHVVPAWLMQALQGGPLAPAMLAQLQAADFLFPGEAPGTYRFKHGLTRDAVYATIGLDERRALHGQVLAMLEQRAAAAGGAGRAGLIDALAYHAAAAGVVEQGLAYAIEAGDAALAAGALDRAQAHYLEGLDLAEALPESARHLDHVRALMNKYGLACIVDPAPDQLLVLARVQALLAQHGPAASGPQDQARDQMRIAYWLGAIAYGVGQGKRSVRHLQQALALAPAQPPAPPGQAARPARDRLLIQVKLAQSLFTAGRYAEAIRLFDQLLPALRQADGRNDRESTAYALACYGFLHADRGQFAQADALFDEAVAVLQDPQRPMVASVLSYQATARLWQGDWAGVLALTEQGLARSQRSRTRHQNLIGHGQAAYARWQQALFPGLQAGVHADSGAETDHQAQARDLLTRTARLFMAPGNSQQRASMVFGWMAELLAHTGERALARSYVGQVLARVRQGGDRLGEAMAWRALARLEQAAGAPARADRCLQRARHAAALRLARREAAHNLLCEAHLLQSRGLAGAAREPLARAADEFSAMDMPFFAQQARLLAQA